jgi:hypothetical protein
MAMPYSTTPGKVVKNANATSLVSRNRLIISGKPGRVSAGQTSSQPVLMNRYKTRWPGTGPPTIMAALRCVPTTGTAQKKNSGLSNFSTMPHVVS